MKIAASHISTRKLEKKYIDHTIESTFPRYYHRRGWYDTVICDSMIYSHRNTHYTKETFTEKLHTHEYYELLIYVRGDVEFITEDYISSPSKYSVIWFLPNQMHTGKLLSPSQYERYVFYFSPDFFTTDGLCTPMLDFINTHSNSFIKISDEQVDEAQSLLNRIDQTVDSQKNYAPLLIKAFLIQLFEIFNTSKTRLSEAKKFTDSMADVKRYIDVNYATISSVSQIASAFFYSREHLSRKFHQTYNLSVYQYLTNKRILESMSLLQKVSVADAAYAVGFRSQSAFITSFKKQVGCLPSEYKARKNH